MINSASGLWPLRSSNDSDNAYNTTPDGKEPIKWEVIERTMGLMPATIIAGRLQTEGIPVRVWQEGAGRALGLTVGVLGTGYVTVPEEFVELALSILEESEFVEVDEEE